MTFKELEEVLKVICFSYGSHNYFGKYDVPSELKYEFRDVYDETELILYVHYTKSNDKLVLLRQKFFGNASTLERHEREESFKHVLNSVIRLLLFGEGESDIRKALSGDIDINWNNPDLPIIIPADRIHRKPPTAE